MHNRCVALRYLLLLFVVAMWRLSDATGVPGNQPQVRQNLHQTESCARKGELAEGIVDTMLVSLAVRTPNSWLRSTSHEICVPEIFSYVSDRLGIDSSLLEEPVIEFAESCTSKFVNDCMLGTFKIHFKQAREDGLYNGISVYASYVYRLSTRTPEFMRWKVTSTAEQHYTNLNSSDSVRLTNLPIGTSRKSAIAGFLESELIPLAVFPNQGVEISHPSDWCVFEHSLSDPSSYIPFLIADSILASEFFSPVQGESLTPNLWELNEYLFGDSCRYESNEILEDLLQELSSTKSEATLCSKLIWITHERRIIRLDARIDSLGLVSLDCITIKNEVGPFLPFGWGW